MISFVVYGIPQPKGSVRAFIVKDKEKRKQKAVVTSGNKQLKSWSQLVSIVAQEHVPQEGLLLGPIEVVLMFYLLRPRTVSKHKRPLPTVKPDIDKLVRSVLDALKGRLYADDSQIVRIEACKYYGDTPRVEITVKEVKDNS